MADSAPDISQVVPPQPMPDVSTPAPVPVLAGSPGSPQAAAAQNRPPTPSPIFYQLIRGLVHPQMVADAPGQTARPVSRLATFETFLGDFVNALGHGLSAAHGPGAFGKGFGAAVGAPYETSLQQFQMGQQTQANQADIQQRQAQAQMQTAQAGMMGQMATVQTPYGPMTLPMSQMGNFMKGGFAAGVNAQAKLTTEQLKLQAQQGQVARVLPGIDPQTNKPAMLAYDKQNRLVGVVPGAFNPASLPKVSTSQQWLETSPGVWDLVDKTSTTRTVIPGASPSGFPKATALPDASPAGNTPGASGAPYSNVPKLNPKPGSRRIVGDVVGVAYDQTANEYVQTTSRDAQANGYQQFQKITAKESEENRQLNNRLADVAQKITRYENAFNAASPVLSMNDRTALASAIADDKFKIGMGADGVGFSLPVDQFNKLIDSLDKKGMSPEAHKLLVAYYNARESMVGYQRVLSGSARSNEKAMELNLDALPNPVQPIAYAREGFQQFKENVNIAGQGLPRMPGITSAKEILNKSATQGKSFSRPSPQSMQDMLNSLGVKQ